MNIYCGICDENIDARRVHGDKIYPHRPDLKDLIFWQCPTCGGYVGTHKNSGKPLGCIVPQAVKEWRQKIHSIIDPLFLKRLIDRSTLYRRIAKKLGIKEYHTAHIRSVQEAEKVYSICLKISKHLQKEAIK